MMKFSSCFLGAAVVYNSSVSEGLQLRGATQVASPALQPMTSAVSPKLAHKMDYRAKLIQLLETHSHVLLVSIDNVGSTQLQDIRMALRGKAVMLFGKNTQKRSAIRARVAETQDTRLENLMSHVQGNMGYIFCENEEKMEEARQILAKNTRPAVAKAGAVAPCDVPLPMGPTGLDPAATNFFQALDIPTKINKGMVETTRDTLLIKKGEKVSPGAAQLLAKLQKKPFRYGAVVVGEYKNGTVFSAEELEDAKKVVGHVSNGIDVLAMLSREFGIEMGSKFDGLAALIGEMQLAAAPVSAAADGAAVGTEAAQESQAEIVEADEDGMGFDLFGDDVGTGAGHDDAQEDDDDEMEFNLF